MDLSNVLSFMNVASFASVLAILGAINGVLTELLKVAPINWTTDNPKKVAWLASAVVVAVFGYVYKEPLETLVLIVPVVAFISHGIYDVVTGWLGKK